MAGTRRHVPSGCSQGQRIQASERVIITDMQDGISLSFLSGPNVYIPDKEIFYDPINGWWAFLPGMPGIIVLWTRDAHLPME